MLNKFRNADVTKSKQYKILCLVLALHCFVIHINYAQVSGKIFRDFNSNGVKDTNESFISGVTVNAYLANATIPCGTTMSSGNTSPNYTLNGCGVADVRIEFILPSAGSCVANGIDFTSSQGINNGSSVQFVKGNSTNVDFAIINPNDFNQGTTGVSVYIPTYVSGDPLPSGSLSGAQPVFLGYPYTNSGPSSLAPTRSINASLIGSTWGVAYSKQANKVFTSAFLKRHVGLGTLGSGGIYMLTPTATSFTVSNFYDMDANGNQTRALSSAPAYGEGTSYTITNNSVVTYLGSIDALTGDPSGLGVIGTNSQRGLNTNPVVPTYDPAIFDQVGKVGLGGLEISDDGKYLFVMNLYSRKVFRLTLNSATNPTAVTSVTSYALPSLSCNNGKIRPFALKFQRGKLYVGVICSGEDGGQNIINGASDLNAYVFELNNPTAAATFNTTAILNIPLNYNKSSSDDWEPWTNNSIKGGTASSDYPTPLLSDIDFTDRGDIIIDFMDRTGHQMGFDNYRYLKSNTLTIDCRTGGDILIAGLNCNGTFTLENNGTISSINNTSYSTNKTGNKGVGGNEFFYDDSNCGDPHDETATGAIAVLKGTNEVYTTVFAGSTEPSDGGIIKLSATNGDYISNSSYTLYNRRDFDGKFGKANGLGDVEFSAIEAPIEIGNRVFFDTDADGIQDAGEAGIDGVTVKLYKAGIQVGNTVTSNGGQWYFNKNNVNLNSATSILYNTAYEIKILAGDIPSGRVLTTKDAISIGAADVADSDASLVGADAVITYTTGNAGENNHTLDFGFNLVPTVSSSVNITSCYDSNGPVSGGTSQVDVKVTVEWSGIASSNSILVTVPGSGATQTINLATATSPTTLTFIVPSASATSGNVTAWVVATPAVAATPIAINIPASNCVQTPCVATNIGGTAWVDTNNNGIRENDETQGVVGITVRAYSNANALLATVITDYLGQYNFSGIVPSTTNPIRVEFTAIPSGYLLAEAGIGSNSAVQFFTTTTCAANLGLFSSVCNSATYPTWLKKGYSVVSSLPGSDNVVLSVKDIRQLGTLYNDPSNYNVNLAAAVPTIQTWTRAQFGGYKVYGITIDQRNANIYVATSGIVADYQHAGGYIFDSIVPARIYKISAGSATPVLWATTPGSLGIGGIDIDTLHNQLFTSDIDNGKIYTFNLTTAAQIGVAYDPLLADNNSTMIPPPLGDAILGIGYNPNENKLYYAVWSNNTKWDGIGFTRASANNNTIRSVKLNSAGAIQTATDQVEMTIPFVATMATNPFSEPVSDIEFSKDGKKVLLAETSIIENASLPKYTVGAHTSRVLEYQLGGSTWNLQAIPSGNLNSKYDVGLPVTYNALNSRGGAVWGYKAVTNGQLVGNEDFVVMTGDALRLLSNDGDFVYGYQFTPSTGGNRANSIITNFGPSSGAKYTFGDVEILKGMATCVPGIEIGNYVWYDTDKDGIQDAGEPPLSGVEVQLKQGATMVAKTTTDTNGNYYFGGATNQGFSFESTTTSSQSVTNLITSTANDARQNTANVINGAAGLYFNDRYLGLRFPSVSIPKGATISSATIRFTASATGTISNVGIKGYKNPDAATFTTATLPFTGSLSDIYTNNATTAAATWNNATSWVVNASGADQTTPSLSSIIQEIVNMPTWDRGKNLAFVLYAPVNASGTTAFDYSGDAAKSAVLSITFTGTSQTTGDSLKVNTAYTISIPLSQTIITSAFLSPTVVDNDASANGDARDSDGTTSSGNFIKAVTTPARGSNHTYDFGFICNTPSYTGVTINQATCTGTTANNNASIVVNSLSGNKAAYSLGTTYTGVVYTSATALSSGSITFGSLPNPTGGQAYTIRLFSSTDCYKDTTVILKSTICYAMCGATNIFQNNSFETGTYTANQTYIDANNAQQFSNSNASTTVTGWNVDHGLWINDATRATDGSKFVEIGTDYACWSDKIGVGTGSTQVCNGSTYELCFDYAAMEATDPTNLVSDNTEIAIEIVNFSSASPQVKRLIGNGGTVLLKDAVTNTTAFAAGAAFTVPTASWDNLRYGIKPIAQTGWHRGCATFTVDFSGFFFTGPLTTMGIAFTKPGGKDMLIDNVKLTKCSGTCVVPPTVTTITANPATCTGSTPNANATVTVSATGGDKVGISGGASYSGAAYASLTTSLSGGTYTFTGLPASTDVPGEFYTVRIFNGNNFAYKDTTILIPYSNCLNKCIIDQFHYSLPQLVDVPWGGTNPVSASNVTVTSTVQGGERDVVSTRTAGSSTVKFNVASWDPGVVYLYSGQPSELGTHTVTYDGVDNNATTINYSGLGGMAMNSGSFTFDTEIDNTTPVGTINYTIRVYSSAANWSYRTLSINTATGYQTLTFTPSAFTIGGGTGANFASVGSVQLITSNTVAGTGWRIKNFFMPCVCVAPTATITGTNTICTGASTTLTASGGTTYLWSTAATTAAINVSPSSTTTYRVTVTNASGCTAIATRTVTVNALPIASASGSAVCVGGTITLTSNGGTSYSWSGPSSFTSTLQNPTRASATAAMSGTYTVTVTGTGGCTSTATASVAVPTLSISNSVSTCINHPLQDVANVSVTLTWTNAPSGDDLKVTINNKIEYISVSSGLTSPQTIVFVVPANGTSSNAITASWVTLTSCTASSTFNAPAACSSDAICEKVLYLCGPVKPADGDAWDHGFMDYLMAVGVSAMTPAYTLPDVTGYGLYNPMSIGTPLSINLNDYTMIVISTTTEWNLAADLLTALKGYSGGILMMNYAEADDLGLTSGNAFYNWQDYAYINNTNQITVYNYDNINPSFGLVQTGANYFSNADAYLWFGANNMSAGNNGIYFYYSPTDVLSGVPATHGARAYLGFHANGLYENAQNGGAIPAPSSSYFTPTKHLTLEAKVYLDNAIKNAATGIILTASGSTVCAGQTITLTATGVGAATYSWSGPNGFTSNLQNPTIANATAAMAGTYTVTATTSNGCTKTATAIVTVNTASLPTVTPASRCGTGTVVLGASGCAGGTLNWYAASTGGASLGTGISFTTPSLSATTTYHVACTASNGCVSTTRTSVAATIAAQPTVGVTGGDVTVCLGASDITLNSTVTGGTGTTSYIWQSSSNNSTWATISGATSSTYVVSATAVSNLYYRVSISMTGTACAANSSVGVRVVVVNDPTILITSDSTNVCSGGNAELSAALTAGAGVCSMQWQSSLNNSVWTTIPGATSNTYSSPPLTRKTYFRVITNCTGNGCGSNVASNVTGVIVQSSCTRMCTSNIMVNSSFEANGVINASPTGWTITGGAGRTANDYVVVGGFAGYLTPTTLGTYGYIYQDILGVFPGANYTVTLFAGTHETTMNHGIAIQFYNSSNVLLGGSGWTEVDHDVDATGNLLLYTLSATAPTGTAYMRIIGRADGDILKLDAFCMQCPTVTLTATISAATICSGSTTTLTSNIAEANMVYQWQSSANNSTWANISGATSSSYTTTVLTSNTYYRIIINSTSGCTVTSASTLVTVVNPPNAGLGSSISMCKTEISATTNLFAMLTGEQAGGSWATTTFPSGMTAAAVNAKITSGVLERKGFPAGTYIIQYTVTGTSPCPNDTENVTITINPCCAPAVCMPMASRRN